VLIICIKPYKLSKSKSSSSGLGTSPGCGRRRERPSGPCIVPGTKWNVKIDRIQRLMLAPGLRSGLDNIPLMYLASTSTTRLRMPMS
jgi:hypothetical protein